MGLFDMFKKKAPRDFKEYVNSLSAYGRKEMLAGFSCYGDPERILTTLLDMPPCYVTEKQEVRINKEYLRNFKKQKMENCPL